MCKDRRCTGAAEPAWSWGGFGGDTHAASQVLPGLGEEGQGPLARLGEPGGGREPQYGGGEVQLGFHQQHSVGHLRAGVSRSGTRSAWAGCEWGHGGLEALPGGADGGGTSRREVPAGGGVGDTPFSQHRLALTDSSAGLHFRWKSLLLHLRSDSSMMSSCGQQPREELKNCHLGFWWCCATPVSVEESDTRAKFGPASSLSPDSPGKHPPHPQTAAENTCLVTQGLEFSVPPALPPTSRQPSIASGTHKLLLHLLHSLQLAGLEELVLGQAAALLQGSPGEGGPEAGPQHQQKQRGDAEVQHFPSEDPAVRGLRWGEGAVVQDAGEDDPEGSGTGPLDR